MAKKSVKECEVAKVKLDKLENKKVEEEYKMGWKNKLKDDNEWKEQVLVEFKVEKGVEKVPTGILLNQFMPRYHSKSKQFKSTAIFKKTRILTPSIANNKHNRSTSPPPVKQEFSFSSDRQAAIVEHFYTFVENELYKFLAENENIIPVKVIENFTKKKNPPISSDFRDADLLRPILQGLQRERAT
ncbi:8759_t:CDS:2 [Funneliformis caledonium]|uniref:8759_t:CDS:1 n=1 Tax=Funneliformis caledonium TaxID=1117310 RepID=A0A9N9CL15_9GLOM|nr:8759_t:CDS:2 [Funneliformis caledonium]